MPTNKFEEEGCIATTFETKYYRRGQVFIKRSLRPREYRTGYRGLYVPPLGKERPLSEAESLRFIHQHTDIPPPNLYCDFLDDDAGYIITEYVDGVNLADLSEAQKLIVCKELVQHRATLKPLRSQQNVIIDPDSLKPRPSLIRSILDSSRPSLIIPSTQGWGRLPPSIRRRTTPPLWSSSSSAKAVGTMIVPNEIFQIVAKSNKLKCLLARSFD